MIEIDIEGTCVTTGTYSPGCAAPADATFLPLFSGPLKTQPVPVMERTALGTVRYGFVQITSPVPNAFAKAQKPSELAWRIPAFCQLRH